MLRLITVTLILALGACSQVRYDLPPVSAAGSERHTGKFVWHDLISDDPQGSQAFYGELFGWTFKSLSLVGADYWVISLDGEPMGGMVAQADVPARKDISQWISVLSVADPAATAAATRAAGGEVLREPVDIGRRGTITVLADAHGAVFAALDTRGADPKDVETLPPQGAFFWHELWTPDVVSASRFYADLGQLSVQDGSIASGDADPIAFNLLRSEAGPRAGVRDLPADDMPALWMPYLRVESRSALDELLARVDGAGGTVLVPAVERPTRGFVAVIAGPSGAPIALQTWGDDEPLLKEI